MFTVNPWKQFTGVLNHRIDMDLYSLSPTLSQRALHGEFRVLLQLFVGLFSEKIVQYSTEFGLHNDYTYNPQHRGISM